MVCDNRQGELYFINKPAAEVAVYPFRDSRASDTPDPWEVSAAADVASKAEG